MQADRTPTELDLDPVRAGRSRQQGFVSARAAFDPTSGDGTRVSPAEPGEIEFNAGQPSINPISFLFATATHAAGPIPTPAHTRLIATRLIVGGAVRGLIKPQQHPIETPSTPHQNPITDLTKTPSQIPASVARRPKTKAYMNKNN